MQSQKNGKGVRIFFFLILRVNHSEKYSLIILLHILPQRLWYFTFKGFSFEESVWRENWGIVGILDKTETESYLHHKPVFPLHSQIFHYNITTASEDWAIKANKLNSSSVHFSLKRWPLFLYVFKLMVKHKYGSFAQLIFICFE